ncbi:hypothetical protein HQ571_05325 [Candidatus Kuenenbacteria bacterium]|nr:hypothetical protein [Candidatus Kuenenbacteria bacterium]
MPNRTKLIIIIATGLIVIAVILIFFIKGEQARKPDAVEDETAPVAKVEISTEEESKLELPAPTAEEQQMGSMKLLSKNFVERFGTYSNQSDYISIKELVPMMSSSMAAWVENTYFDQLIKEHDPDGYYYEITTLAPVAYVMEQTPSTAKVKVSAQRVEKKADQESTQFLQDVILELVKRGDNWVVDAAYWQ